MGRTGHHEDCGPPNFGLLQSTETIIAMPIKLKKGKRTLKRIF